MKRLIPRSDRISVAWTILVFSALITAAVSLDARPLIVSEGHQANFDALVKQGDAFVKSHQYDEAIAVFTKAIELNPKNGAIFVKRGWAKYYKNDYEGALFDAGKSILLDPLDHLAYDLKAVSLSTLERYDESLETYDTVLSLDPQYYVGYFDRAGLKAKKQDYAGAIADMTKAIELNPNEPDAFGFRGRFKWYLKDTAGAVADTCRALELNPKDPVWLLERGFMLMKTGDPAAARKDINKVLEIEPGNQKALDLLKQLEPTAAANGPAPAASKPAAAPAVRVESSMIQPKLIKHVEPEYPAVAQTARVEGIVILEATIDKTGQVVETKILRSIPLLDDAAVAAVKQWRYEPYMLNGAPVKFITTVTVRFSLKWP